MKKFVFLLPLLLLFFSCHKFDVNEKGLYFKTITVDGVQRRYAVYVPENFGKNLPVVFCLHGGGMHIERMTGTGVTKSPYKLWFEIAENYGAIIVYPEALEKIEDRPNWNDCRADCEVCSDADDVKFLLTLLDTIQKKYKTDEKRVFFCGPSNGGFMTLRMATCAPDKITAIGVIIASLPDTSECAKDPETPIPAVFINGTADPMLPYEGGIIGNPPDPTHGTCKPVEETINFWVKLNGCNTTPETETLPDLDTEDSSYIKKYFYDNPENDNDVLFYKVIGGGHAAPSIAQQYSEIWTSYVGPQNHDMETVYVLWDFFKDKKK